MNTPGEPGWILVMREEDFLTSDQDPDRCTPAEGDVLSAPVSSVSMPEGTGVFVDTARELVQRLADAEAERLADIAARNRKRSLFSWDRVPVWQDDMETEDKTPPWRSLRSAGGSYFSIVEIERILMRGNHGNSQ